MAEKRSLIKRIVSLYVDGFKGMGSLGKSLWILLIVKLILLFAVMKLFFFPDFLSTNFDSDEERAQYVRSALAPASEEEK